MAGTIHTEILPTLRLLIMCILQYDKRYYNLLILTMLNINVQNYYYIVIMVFRALFCSLLSAAIMKFNIKDEQKP